MMSYSQYLILIFVKNICARDNRHGRGSHSSTCVGDGEVLFLGHHVAWNCGFSVQTTHVRETCWISGQPCLLLSTAMGIIQQDPWTTSLQHSNAAIVYVKSTSSSPRFWIWKDFWQQYNSHFRS